MTDPAPPQSPKARSKFPPLYWLVVMFEFFERGSYYGMMSVLSVYLTDVLKFAKEDVGVIKSTIQPLLYFLPIISGALADRFGYRRTLMVAFALLGVGYFLTSQATEYATVFLALVVMGLGAGTFKPVISGTIARCTDETNSTLGFGIFYWSINLGAFLFPLFLVPYLKNNVGWTWVIVASAICTGAMLIPTVLVFREPPAGDDDASADKPPLLQTLANAFEIIYSPFILLYHRARAGAAGQVAVGLILAVTLGGGGYAFLTGQQAEALLTEGKGEEARKVRLTVAVDAALGQPYLLEDGPGWLRLTVTSEAAYRERAEAVRRELATRANLPSLQQKKLDKTVRKAAGRPFLLLFVGLLFAFALLALRVGPSLRAGGGSKLPAMAGTLGGIWAVLLLLHLVMGLSAFATILCAIIAVTLLSLFAIDTSDPAPEAAAGTVAPRFSDHFKFLLMIFIYSGFWVLYFQMFDSVLWYVQDYVDAASLNAAVNGALTAVGLPAVFKFDVEHVTVINAGTIILLQLLISRIVKNTAALPTMMVGIGLGTGGMAILAVSADIWVFMAGITLFSIGEMTAHPKFISYVGQTAPKSRVAMYMGYLFLYGVIGASIGGVVGANLYVKFVDELSQPRTLWLIFSSIGVATIVGLLLYNKLVAGTSKA